MTEVRPIDPHPTSSGGPGRRVVAMLHPAAASGLIRYVGMLSAEGIETFTGDFREIPDNRTLLRGTQAILVETAGTEDADDLQRMARLVGIPVIAVVADLGLAEARLLMRRGMADVLPLPLGLGDLRDALQTAEKLYHENAGPSRNGTLCAFAKSVGGVGATMIAIQCAGMLASELADERRSVCLIDFDVQFGAAALQLDLHPRTTLGDLLAAGNRLDGELLKSVAVRHSSGLHVIAAPEDVLPLETVSSEMALKVLQIATEQFDVVFADLPGSWTNWSLDIIGRAELTFLVTELSVPSIRQARRQLQLLQRYDMTGLPLKIIANRYERGWLKAIDTTDAEQVLGRPIDYLVANDYRTVSAAIDQGKMLAEIKAKSRVERDLEAVVGDIKAQVERREMAAGLT